MRPTQMMTALLATSALLVGCSPNPDPSNIGAIKTAPVAMATNGFRAAKEGEKITASVYAYTSGINSAVAAGFEKEVRTIEQCYKYGVERAYMLGYAGRITCTGEDEAPLARFSCDAAAASCKPVLKF